MKNPAGLIVTVLVIVAPIVWCTVNLININKEYDKNIDEMQSMTDNINNVIDNDLNNSSTENEDVSGEDTYDASMGGESYQSSIGAPIGKIIEGAKINVNAASVYAEANETSNIIGTVAKNTEVTIQDYPNNWSRVKVGDLSGWVRTDCIDKPAESGNTTIGSVVGKKAIINAESLRVRKTPVDGEVMTTLTKGTDVKIMAVNEENTWYQVQWRTTLGWVSSEYVTVEY